MKPEAIIIICEMVSIIAVLRLCIVLIGLKKRYRAWKQEQDLIDIKETYEAGRKKWCQNKIMTS